MRMLLHQLLQQTDFLLISWLWFLLILPISGARKFGCLTWGNEIVAMEVSAIPFACLPGPADSLSLSIEVSGSVDYARCVCRLRLTVPLTAPISKGAYVTGLADLTADRLSFSYRSQTNAFFILLYVRMDDNGFRHPHSRKPDLLSLVIDSVSFDSVYWTRIPLLQQCAELS